MGSVGPPGGTRTALVYILPKMLKDVGLHMTESCVVKSVAKRAVIHSENSKNISNSEKHSPLRKSADQIRKFRKNI